MYEHCSMGLFLNQLNLKIEHLMTIGFQRDCGESNMNKKFLSQVV